MSLFVGLRVYYGNSRLKISFGISKKLVRELSMPAFIFPPTCPPFPGLPMDMSTISSSTVISNSTQSHSNTTSPLMSSAGMVLSVPNPIRESPRDGVVGPIAALEQRAATLMQRAIQAAAVAILCSHYATLSPPRQSVTL